MPSNTEGSIGNADNAAVGRHNVQASVSMQGELSQALQDLRLELRLMRRDMDIMVQNTSRYWFSLVIVLVVVVVLAVIGDRQVTALRVDVHEMQQQLQQQAQQLQTLQYQVQVLRQQAQGP